MGNCKTSFYLQQWHARGLFTRSAAGTLDDAGHMWSGFAVVVLIAVLGFPFAITLWPLLDDVRADSSFRWRAKASYKHSESCNCEMQTLAMLGAGLGYSVWLLCLDLEQQMLQSGSYPKCQVSCIPSGCVLCNEWAKISNSLLRCIIICNPFQWHDCNHSYVVKATTSLWLLSIFISFAIPIKPG